MRSTGLDTPGAATTTVMASDGQVKPSNQLERLDDPTPWVKGGGVP